MLKKLLLPGKPIEYIPGNPAIHIAVMFGFAVAKNSFLHVANRIFETRLYNARGEAQLSGYLDCYHLDKGYMASFNFNQKKQVGVREIALSDKILIEATV